MEQKAVATKKARDFAEQKVRMLEDKQEDSDSKLAQAISVVSTCDKELANLKETMKQSEQTFYNMGFTDAENSYSPVIFEAQRLGLAQVWMAVVDAFNLPETSPFRNPT